MAQNNSGTVTPTSDITSDVEEMALKEKRHEIVELIDKDGHFGLQLGAGYESQWHEVVEAFKAGQENRLNEAVSSDSMVTNVIETPVYHENRVLVVSFLGNTSAGKSYLVRHLLKKQSEVNCSDGPLCIDEKKKYGATTTNINCYVVEPLFEQNILVLDYEGEKGSGFPLLHHAQNRLAGISRTAEKAQMRRKAVSEYFPKLAYCLSDVIILVGTEDLASMEYLNRFQEFVFTANNGLSQVGKLPMLIIIQNKASLLLAKSEPEEIIERFFKIHGEEARRLENYFSNIRCFTFPHRDLLQRIEGKIVDGEKIFDENMVKLKYVLKEECQKRRTNSLTHAQWLYLLRSLLPDVQRGKLISLHTLLSETTNIDDDRVIDIPRRCFLRVYDSQAIHSQEWFDNCFEFSGFILIHLLIIEARSRLVILSSTIIGEQCKKNLEQLVHRLADFQPCVALYQGRGRLSNDGADNKPIYCYQHKGVHQYGHRTSQPVYGLSKIKDFLGWKTMDVWSGEFIASVTDRSKDLIKSMTVLLEQLYGKFQLEPNAQYEDFVELLVNYKVPNPREIFALICFCQNRSSSNSGHNPGSYAQGQQRSAAQRLGFFEKLLNIFRARNTPVDTIPIECETCYRKLQNILQRKLQNNHSYTQLLQASN